MSTEVSEGTRRSSDPPPFIVGPAAAAHASVKFVPPTFVASAKPFGAGAPARTSSVGVLRKQMSRTMSKAGTMFSKRFLGPMRLNTPMVESELTEGDTLQMLSGTKLKTRIIRVTDMGELVWDSKLRKHTGQFTQNSHQISLFFHSTFHSINISHIALAIFESFFSLFEMIAFLFFLLDFGFPTFSPNFFV
jgi:hypothetical protein